MVVYIDGNEHSGKTTLANYLAEHYGALVLHHGYRFRDKIFAYHTTGLLKAYYAPRDQLVVFDRLWMSEAVYGEVYRGGTRWPHQGRMFDRILRRLGALNVVCVTDPAHASSIVRDKPGRDLYQDQAKAAEVASHFLGLVNRQLTLPGSKYEDGRPRDGNYFFELQYTQKRDDIVHYDYRYWDVKEAAEWIVEEARSLQTNLSAECNDRSLMNLAGRLELGRTDQVLMVGDRCKARNDRVAWPFFAYHDSSLYLAEALSRAGIQEEQLIWTNANDPGFDRVVQECVAVGGVRRFVALGRSAEEALLKLADESSEMRPDQIRRVPHPQVVRRFDYSNSAGYGAEIKAAIESRD
jgi:adenylate kinase family enzyme